MIDGTEVKKLKERTTVYAEKDLLKAAQAAGLNLSEIFNDALHAALRVPSEREALLKRRTQLAAELSVLDRKLGEVEAREAKQRERRAAETLKLRPYREFYAKRSKEGWPTAHREAWLRALAEQLGYEVSELERLLKSPE